MTSTASKPLCASCQKNIGQFKCEGCIQSFCLQHVTEHRQDLSHQLEEIIIEHDSIQQNLSQNTNQHRQFMVRIDQWEEKSIEKVRKAANDIRQQVNQCKNIFNINELNKLKGQIRIARESNDFFENDLRNWRQIVENLKSNLNTSFSSSNIQEDQKSPLICSIRITSTTSNASAVKLHARLKYTNRDGIYVNPKSFLVTAVWYFYSPKHNKWFWTPYQNFDFWMSVDSIIVKSGFYKDQTPATINVEIIEYLRNNNPIPPDEIVQVASAVENTLLKL